MAKKIDFKEIITLEDVAEKVGLNVETIQKWRERGMPVIKIDKYIRAYWPQVLEWIVKQQDERMPLFEKNGKN